MSLSSETVQKMPQMSFSEEEWCATPAAVQEFVRTLIKRVEQLEAEVVDLRERVNRNSQNSSQPPSQDGPQVESKGAKKSGSGRKPGGQPGHKGYSRKLVPVEEVKEVQEVKPAVCGNCGQGLEGEDPEPYRHQVVEIPAVVAEVKEYRVHWLKCPGCGSENRGELPEGVAEGGFGPRLQAMVSLLRGRYPLSKRDIGEGMSDFFRAEVSLGMVPTLEQRSSEAIEAAVLEAQQYVQTQPVANLDETGWREGNKRAWLWVGATTWVSVFVIRLSRGGQVARELLGELFKGIVVSDRWSGYNWLSNSCRQLCWSHLRRDFQAFVERGDESQRLGEALLAEVELMFRWWHRVRDGTLSRLAFQEGMQGVERRVGELLRQGLACSHSKTAGTCRELLKHEGALWTFVHVEGIEPTNNFAERQVRRGVLWRNRSFGTQSEAGSRFAERMMTVVTTLKQQHRFW